MFTVTYTIKDIGIIRYEWMNGYYLFDLNDKPLYICIDPKEDKDIECLEDVIEILINIIEEKNNVCNSNEK